MRRCKHNHDHVVTKYGECTFDMVGNIVYGVEFHKCLDCGAWLSMGPSNDKSEAVRIEMRAAELAAGGDMICCGDVDDIGDCEECGCVDYETGTDPMSTAQWAGYLARAIVSHEDETP